MNKIICILANGALSLCAADVDIQSSASVSIKISVREVTNAVPSDYVIRHSFRYNPKDAVSHSPDKDGIITLVALRNWGEGDLIKDKNFPPKSFPYANDEILIHGLISNANYIPEYWEIPKGANFYPMESWGHHHYVKFHGLADFFNTSGINIASRRAPGAATFYRATATIVLRRIHQLDPRDMTVKAYSEGAARGFPKTSYGWKELARCLEGYFKTQEGRAQIGSAALDQAVCAEGCDFDLSRGEFLPPFGTGEIADVRMTCQRLGAYDDFWPD